MRRFRIFRAVLVDLIFIPAFLFALLNTDLVTYVLRMGKGQLDIILEARDFQEVFDDPGVDLKIKDKLHLIERIRQFAFDSIGLVPNENYTSYYQQPEDQIIFVVTACEKFKLKAYEWEFPVIGSVPYKGFFNKGEAEMEYNRLKHLGYDVNIGNASGWSTLGWFNDPVLSQMLQLPEGELAELIIHELTHGTIYIADSAEYNENLATFVGVTGAAWYLSSTYGKDSKQYHEYIDGGVDSGMRTDFMLNSALYADSVYATLPQNAEAKRKIGLRIALFDTITQRAARIPFKSDTTYSKRLHKHLWKSGNTVLMNYVRYSGKQSDFADRLSELHGDLRSFLKWILQRGSAQE